MCVCVWVLVCVYVCICIRFFMFLSLFTTIDYVFFFLPPFFFFLCRYASLNCSLFNLLNCDTNPLQAHYRINFAHCFPTIFYYFNGNLLLCFLAGALPPTKLLKATSCFNYKNGSCKFGDKCRFLHADVTPLVVDAPVSSALLHVSHSKQRPPVSGTLTLYANPTVTLNMTRTFS